MSMDTKKWFEQSEFYGDLADFDEGGFTFVDSNKVVEMLKAYHQYRLSVNSTLDVSDNEMFEVSKDGIAAIKIEELLKGVYSPVFGKVALIVLKGKGDLTLFDKIIIDDIELTPRDFHPRFKAMDRLDYMHPFTMDKMGQIKLFSERDTNIEEMIIYFEHIKK